MMSHFITLLKYNFSYLGIFSFSNPIFSYLLLFIPLHLIDNFSYKLLLQSNLKNTDLRWSDNVYMYVIICLICTFNTFNIR